MKKRYILTVKGLLTSVLLESQVDKVMDQLTLHMFKSGYNGIVLNKEGDLSFVKIRKEKSK